VTGGAGRLDRVGNERILFMGCLTAALLWSWSADARTSPVDLFTTHRDQCDHFRGEEPFNAARAREIATKMKRYCTGTDRELRRLRKKYAHDPRILKRLSQYEDSIE
jgi:hypothetical protein